MQRSEVVATLHSAQLPDLAELAEQSLPEQVELKEVQDLLARYGVTRDVLADRMGASP